MSLFDKSPLSVTSSRNHNSNHYGVLSPFLGTVPPSISNLTNLKQLFLDDNAIAGDIKLLEPLTNLEALLLEDNFFEGAITESMVNTWQALEIFDVSSNNLTGTIPPTLFTLSNLTVFDGHANGFTGALPDISQVGLVKTDIMLYGIESGLSHHIVFCFLYLLFHVGKPCNEVSRPP